MVPEFTMLGPWQCEHFCGVGGFALVDLCLIAVGIGLLLRGRRIVSAPSAPRRRRRTPPSIDVLSSSQAIRDQFFTAKTHSDPPGGTLASRSSPENSE